LLIDLKIALRRLRGAPGFSAVAALTLALAIGANAAVFSIADAVLFRPLPYEDAGSVFVALVQNNEDGGRYTRIRYDQVEIIRRADSAVVDVGMLERASPLLVPSASGAESVAHAEVTANYFELLGVQAAHGRLFNPEDILSGGTPAVLTWQSFGRRFGGDGNVVGSAVTLGSTTLDIVGVLPAGFVFPSRDAGSAEILTVMAPPPAGSDGGTFYPLVRLRPGVTRGRADAQIAAIAAEVPPTAGEPRSVPVLEDVRSQLYPIGRPIMRLLVAASLLVLLLGCANLANMLLARTRLREREIGVQAALGASRAGLLRPLMLEGLLLGISGSLAALAMTALAFGFLLRQVPPTALGHAPVGVSGRVAAFTLLLGVVASLAFAAFPAWRASRLDAQSLLRGAVFGSTRRASFGQPMLAAQVGLAVVLVFGALVTTRAFVAVLQVPLGFDSSNVVTVSIFPPIDDPAARQAFFLRALDDLEARPDVIVAGAAGTLPLEGAFPFRSEGVVSPQTGEFVAGIEHVLPGYFEATGIELLRGRLPARSDAANGADIAVVTESAAGVLFSGRDPIGASFTNNIGLRRTVVGIVAEVTNSLARESEPGAYVIPNAATRRLRLVVKVRARNDETLADIRRQVSDLAPGVPIEAAWWSDEIAAITEYRNPRFQTLVLGSFATLALGLTALGVFGLVAFLVAARMREMGIRMALGAGPLSLIVQALRHALLPTAVGLVAGLLATRALARLAAAQLYEVDTSDPATLAAAAVSVAVAATLAAWLPARRAARVDPMTVLRID
jgi:predicted permease